MAEMMGILSVVSFLLAGVFGMVAVVLWFRFDICGSGKRRKGDRAEDGLSSHVRRAERTGTRNETERLDRGEV